jgi:hypothetical protein
MEDFTIPSIGARFKKMGVLYTHPPKCYAHSQTSSE